MNLGMSLGLTQTIQQRPELLTELDLHQELLAMRALIREIRDASPYSAKNGLKKVLEEVVNTISNPKFTNLKKMIQDLTLTGSSAEAFQALLLERLSSIAKNQFDSVELAASLIYQLAQVAQVAQGQFSIQTTDAAGVSKTHAAQIDKAVFMQAVLKPDVLERERSFFVGEILRLEESKKNYLTRTEEDNLVSAYQEVKKLEEAQLLASNFGTQIQTIKSVFDLLFKQPVHQEPLLKNFCYDAHVLQGLDFIVSARLVNQFKRIFEKITRKSEATEGAYSDGLSNLAARFALVSMGVLEPEIFKLHRQTISDDVKEAYLYFCAQNNLTPEAFEKKYNLKTEGAFFWNRYFVSGQRATGVTEELIRKFITDVFRKDKAVFLEAMNYEENFDDFMDDFLECKKELKKIDPSDENAWYGERLNWFFGQDAFTKLIIQKIQTKPWRDALEWFYKKT